ncbi:glycosyltransferase family 9 protein [Niastella sp. OAS944]|uniref:glycosyltransferase family 9 protein n=1 Tax=Niastella sp. OAS944 TaxID=2664089 RepID=UPI00347939B0|nr:ADP-heptose:LPS heptosyltransferase [Chitinophagaceae bacterium OAS944]
MKILIIRFSSIGDIVLTTPVIRCLKKQLPGVEVHYLTKASYKAVLEANPYIDKLHFLQDDLQAVIPQLQAEDFAYVIDLHHNLRTMRVKKALGRQSFSFNKLNIQKFILTTIKLNVMPDVHIVDRYLDTLQSLGVKNDGRGLDYFIPEKDKVKESDIPAGHLAGYIGVVIGAAHNTKKLPLHKLKELCAAIDHPIILLGGKEDRELGEQIAGVDASKIYNSCGKFNINESADLVRRAKLIITHDTGLMHIASAFKKPVISIWGNTVPSFGMYPYYGALPADTPKDKLPYDIMEVKPLYCRPCSKIGYNKCPLGHFKCMEKISMQEVVENVHRRIGWK